MAKKKKRKPPHPNDRFFRGYLGNRSNARKLLRWQLPEVLQKKLNWNTMRVKSSTFVDERLRRHESDLLIEFRTREEQPVLVYVLWEHQSKVEPLMAWRILEYRTEITKLWLQENPTASSLPYIHAVVLYQGKGKWRAPLDVSELIVFEADEGRQNFSSEYDVLSVNELPAIGYPADTALRLGLSLMRAVTMKEQCEWLVDSAADLNRLLKQAGGDVSFRLAVEYIFITADENEVMSALEQTKPEIKKAVMTYAETLEERGVEKGIEKGQRQIVDAMLTKGLTPAEISDLTGLPERQIKKLADSKPRN